jgi:2-polyprenyl-6-hydroxyphenyl methylase/3-demethylubiquinone-9 3-methyltransferase
VGTADRGAAAGRQGVSNAGVETNVSAQELARFDRLAARWWDADGESRALHDLNPLRLAYVTRHAALKDAEVLDVGCGGGLLSEAMAAAGARVTGLELAPAVLDVARLHLLESGLSVDYIDEPVEQLARRQPGRFDVVTCMEMLEHVPEPASILQACAELLRPGGWLLLSTLNRTPKSFALAIVGAEYVLRLLPRGTHRFTSFIRPAEIAGALRAAGLVVEDVSGMRYNPFARKASLCSDVDVNYLVAARKPE